MKGDQKDQDSSVCRVGVSNASKMMRTMDKVNAELFVIHQIPEYQNWETLADTRRSKHRRVFFFNADTEHTVTRSRHPVLNLVVFERLFINNRYIRRFQKEQKGDVHCSTPSRTVVDAGGTDCRAQTCVLTQSNISSCHCQSLLDHLSDPTGY